MYHLVAMASAILLGKPIGLLTRWWLRARKAVRHEAHPNHPMEPHPVTRADGRPAYVGAPPRITATMVRQFGSYQAARNAMGEGRGNG